MKNLIGEQKGGLPTPVKMRNLFARKFSTPPNQKTALYNYRDLT